MSSLTPVFPSTYLGSIQYFANLIHYNQVQIEQHCKYQRKTLRNRTSILGANGQMALSLPVTNHKNQATRTKDTLINYETNWQKQHWRSIVSAYNSSPFFEYYSDEIAPFYQKKHKYLIDFNTALTQVILEELGADTHLTLTDEFLNSESLTGNYRYLSSPKIAQIKDLQFKSTEYRQVFAEKHAFCPNLSIIDLLFNKGPESLLFLEESLAKSE